jgi:HEPN domain-containing protein
MSMNLTFTEMHEIEQHSYFKANTILGEAQNYLGRFNYDLAVRRAQESFELFLKSLFRFLQAEYPASHDLKKQIYDLTAAFKQHQVDPNQIPDRQIARLVLANSMLDLWRLPAFYGDEKLKVGGIFEEGEAKLALAYAELAQYLCNVVRGHVYQRAATAQAT